ncbi:3',5'-cyclic adenosine monophosphate phosphodiesterase CpdA [invertebrate metagenome]|uniref:3',5'-cyclic adenosine monophosphate phosphodiesterase CpdA n=1 Tax=invertebrate metagenome TaxID=1711999 RepID=A0A2H9TB44_9ZZZZ
MKRNVLCAVVIISILAASSMLFHKKHSPPEKKPSVNEPGRPLPDESHTFSPFVPQQQPDRICLTLTHDPTTSINIQWRTHNLSGHPVVQIALLSAGPIEKTGIIQTCLASSQIFRHPHYDAVHHHANITGLKPATTYLYRVGDGLKWSEWFQFQTSQPSHQPFEFLFFGDLQEDIRGSCSRIIRQAFLNHPNTRFMLFIGDIVRHGNNDTEWHEFFQATGWLTGMFPTIATPGNHEYKNTQITSAWGAHFQFPSNGPQGCEELNNTCYFIDYQGTRFISLNTNAMRGFHLKAVLAQRQWLQTLLRNNDNDWTVIFHHHPVDSPTQSESGKKQLQWLFSPLYEKYHVDLVLQGDAHTYGRGHKSHDKNNPDSPIYIVSNSGAHMNKPDAPWASVSGSDKQLYQHISISKNQLNYQAIAADGSLFDHFILKK